ncbi:unnamed protein product [Pleuronectes platessa]|uniref:Uncharacterized protein n=1 Tax=Pleuronectes platessa TaxID=8262 RepID=A0A9N7U155_PLEPL|nr:unnamed protein product [Pleuronectes platessa]
MHLTSRPPKTNTTTGARCFHYLHWKGTGRAPNSTKIAEAATGRLSNRRQVTEPQAHRCKDHQGFQQRTGSVRSGFPCTHGPPAPGLCTNLPLIANTERVKPPSSPTEPLSAAGQSRDEMNVQRGDARRGHLLLQHQLKTERIVYYQVIDCGLFCNLRRLRFSSFVLEETETHPSITWIKLPVGNEVSSEEMLSSADERIGLISVWYNTYITAGAAPTHVPIVHSIFSSLVHKILRFFDAFIWGSDSPPAWGGQASVFRNRGFWTHGLGSGDSASHHNPPPNSSSSLCLSLTRCLSPLSLPSPLYCPAQLYPPPGRSEQM